MTIALGLEAISQLTFLLDPHRGSGFSNARAAAPSTPRGLNQAAGEPDALGPDRVHGDRGVAGPHGARGS